MEPELVAAIAAVADVARSVGRPPVLIGALASAAAAGRSLSVPTPRATLDADFALQVSSWEEYRALLEALVVRGHRKDAHIEHRVYIHGVKVDILPYGAGVAPDGRSLVWPTSGLTMDVTGFEEAAGSAEELEIGPGIRIRCLTIPGFTLLKVAAFLDRHRRGDIKHKSDAQDLHFWFRHYASDVEDERRYRLEGLQEAGIEYDAAGAAVLGAEVSGLASPAAAQRVSEFLEVAGADDGPFLLATVGQTFDEDEERRKIQAIKALIRAFGWGFRRPAAGT